ncbi:hypothetical protein D3C71_1266250 [compost metagenome]
MAACRPLVENGLPLRLVHLLQRHQRAGLLLVLQAQETVRQPQVLQGPRARYCTYFIYTIITYCTVLLRNPKRAVRRGFRPCFGFRRRARSIPKKGFLAFFGFVVRTLLWITWRRPAMQRHALRQHLQAGRQRAAAEQRVFGNLLERVHAHDLHRLGGMGQRLADQAEVVGIELHRLEGRQRFVVQHVEVALDAAGLRVALSSHQAEPACQPQQRQGARHGLVRCLRRARHRGQVGAQLVVGGKGGHAVVVELQAEHLPGVALQRRQASVEEQSARHALMAVAAVEKAVLARRRALRRFLRLKVPQRLVEQRRQRNRAIAP